MELVHGVPITRYCDDNHLTPRQRLELYVPVCLAIQHAHQKGIIHCGESLPNLANLRTEAIGRHPVCGV
jgi:serine/threonine protein kinase